MRNNADRDLDSIRRLVARYLDGKQGADSVVNAIARIVAVEAPIPPPEAAPAHLDAARAAARAIEPAARAEVARRIAPYQTRVTVATMQQPAGCAAPPTPAPMTREQAPDLCAVCTEASAMGGGNGDCCAQCARRIAGGQVLCGRCRKWRSRGTGKTPRPCKCSDEKPASTGKGETDER